MDFDAKKLLAILKNLLPSKDVKENLRGLASKYLSYLSMANTGPGRFIAKQSVKKQFNKFSKRVAAGEFDAKLNEISAQMKATTREEIRAKVEDIFLTANDPAKAREYADKFAASMKNISEDEYVRVMTSFASVLPDALEAVHNAIILQGKSPEEFARAFYKMTPDEKAAFYLENAKKIPTDAIVDAVYETLQKATPEKVKAAAIALLDNTEISDVTKLALGAIDVGHDLLKNVKKHDSIDIKDRKAAAEFGAGLKQVFNQLADSLKANGMTPDTDLEAAFRKAFAKPANDNATETPKTEPKPKKGNTGLDV